MRDQLCRLISIVPFTVGLACCGQAWATLVDFDDVAPTYTNSPLFGNCGPADCAQTTLLSRGFEFSVPAINTAQHVHLVSSPYHASGTVPAHQYYAYNGTQYIGLDAWQIAMRLPGGGAFALMSIDAAEGFLIDPLGERNNLALAPLHPNTATRLRVIGTYSGGGTVVQDFDFDGVNDSFLAPNAADFQTFLLPTTFTDLVSVEFQGLNPGDGHPFGAFNIDNVSVTPTAMPLPSTAWLVLSALGVLAGLRKRYQSLAD
ncbi:MAG: hypothetical protein EXR27_10375 [Betaproteobacteria bacterium]|nr:hypothetical protein [Betaproteobacteria bacterium]